MLAVTISNNTDGSIIRIPPIFRSIHICQYQATIVHLQPSGSLFRGDSLILVAFYCLIFLTSSIYIRLDQECVVLAFLAILISYSSSLRIYITE